MDIALLRSEIRTPLFVLSVPAVTTTLIRILLVRVALIRVALILLWRIIRLPLLRGRSGDTGNIWQRDCDPRLLLLRRRERTPQERRNCPNSASPPSTVSMSRPCDVVVSAHVSPSERKPAFLAVMAARVFNRSRVDRCM